MLLFYGMRPLWFIAMHLIVRPEYLKRVSEAHPNVEIVAMRLDRVLFSAKLLALVPGDRGFGEIMNNLFD